MPALDTGVLYRDDCLDRLSALPSQTVDLIYLDPPFFSNRTYEVIWGEEAEVRSFEDRWDGGIETYIDWMRERVMQMRRVLKATGSIYLHCDPHASHYLKVMLDEIFGIDRFLNEIIWKRTSAHSSAKRWAPVHDVILYYGVGVSVTWNPPRKGYSAEYLDKYYKYHDGDGRLYWRADLCASGRRNGSSGMPWRGFDPGAKGMHWKYGTDRLDQLDAEGRIYWPPRGKGWPQYKRYRDELKGVALGDFWDDIDRINPVAKERLGYPTQKPESLLRRIILASSNEGDVVLDPFCGCGTSIAVAQELRRRWIGIDISATAMEVMKRRLSRLGSRPVVINEPGSIQDLKKLKPFEFRNWVINSMVGTQAPRGSNATGFDGYSFFTNEPILIRQSENLPRGVVDTFETAVRRASQTSGYIVAFSFARAARAEVARAKKEGFDITLVTVAELLIKRGRPYGKAIPHATDADAPVLEIRQKADLPSVQTLIESERRQRFLESA